MSELAGRILTTALLTLFALAAFFWGRRWREDTPALTKPKVPLRVWLCVFGAAFLSRILLLLVLRVTDSESSLESMLSRWDAPHYLWIAQNGYTADQSLGDGWLYIVFYPLYPALTALFGGSFAASILVSWVCLAGACCFLFAMGEQDEAGKGYMLPIFLVTFPTAFFTELPYTEALFLLTTSGFLYALRRRKWLEAGIWGFFAALTRSLGLLTAFPYLVEWLCAHRLAGPGWREGWKGLKAKLPAMIRTALPGFLIFLGMGIYLLINYIVYGDPMKFSEIQAEHWSQRMGTITNTFSYTVSNALGEDSWAVYLWRPQLLWMILSLLVLPFAVRKLRPAEGIYTVAYTVTAMLPTWLLSYPRYYMGMVTLYPLLAKLFPKVWQRALWCAVCGAWMLGQAVAFTQGAPIL